MCQWTLARRAPQWGPGRFMDRKSGWCSLRVLTNIWYSTLINIMRQIILYFLHLLRMIMTGCERFKHPVPEPWWRWWTRRTIVRYTGPWSTCLCQNWFYNELMNKFTIMLKLRLLPLALLLQSPSSTPSCQPPTTTTRLWRLSKVSYREVIFVVDY